MENMDKDLLDKAYFISFCIEQYKHEKGLTGEQAMRVLDKYGALAYLEENFEVLHTQSRQWILEDLDEFINHRKEEVEYVEAREVRL